MFSLPGVEIWKVKALPWFTSISVMTPDFSLSELQVTTDDFLKQLSVSLKTNELSEHVNVTELCIMLTFPAFSTRSLSSSTDYCFKSFSNLIDPKGLVWLGIIQFGFDLPAQNIYAFFDDLVQRSGFFLGKIW